MREVHRLVKCKLEAAMVELSCSLVTSGWRRALESVEVSNEDSLWEPLRGYDPRPQDLM